LLVALPRPYAAGKHATPEEVAQINRYEDNGYVDGNAYCAVAGVGVMSSVQAARASVGEMRKRVLPDHIATCSAQTSCCEGPGCLTMRSVTKTSKLRKYGRYCHNTSACTARHIGQGGPKGGKRANPAAYAVFISEKAHRIAGGDSFPVAALPVRCDSCRGSRKTLRYCLEAGHLPDTAVSKAYRFTLEHDSTSKSSGSNGLVWGAKRARSSSSSGLVWGAKRARSSSSGEQGLLTLNPKHSTLNSRS
jgi:hypothetical protein